MNEDKQTQYIDPTVAQGGNGGVDNPLSFEFLVLVQVQTVLRNESADLRGGGYVDRPFIGAGGTFTSIIRNYEEATHQKYVHSVYALYDLLAGEIGEKEEALYQTLMTEVDALRTATQEKTQQVDLDRFYYEKAMLMRKLFQGLMVFIKSKDYFSGQGYGNGYED